MRGYRQLQLRLHRVELTAMCVGCGCNHWVLPDMSDFSTTAEAVFLETGAQSIVQYNECHMCREELDLSPEELATGQAVSASLEVHIPNMPGPAARDVLGQQASA